MEYSIVFNPAKSKLLCFNSVSSDNLYNTLYGKHVDVVDNYLHLGNRIYNNIYTQCSNSMILYLYRRSNQVNASFRMYDSFTLTVFMTLNYITLIRTIKKCIYSMA